LTSSKHIRSNTTQRPTASRRASALSMSKRNEFRNVTVSISSEPIIQANPQLTPQPNPNNRSPQGPRRPRLSSFRCNCQTAIKAEASEPDSPAGAIRPQRSRRSQFRPTRPETCEPLRPRLSAGRRHSKVQPEIQKACFRSTRQRRRCAAI
jgi:hypothetical protein